SELIPFYFSENHTIKLNGLLTVGGNPSFVKSNIDKFLASEANIGGWAADDFQWANRCGNRVELSNAEEAYAKSEYSRYFRPFWNLRDLLVCDWEHTDVYRLRTTKQNKLNDVLLRNPSLVEAQLTLFETSLNLMQPKMILVANASSSDAIVNRLSPRWNEQHGCHEIIVGRRTIPVILAAMLTNRVTDKYSKQRLFWLAERIWQEYD
ncbi:MAG: hypothetical protein AAGB04_28785, partial [Pseudomonadota bacterium]